MRFPWLLAFGLAAGCSFDFGSFGGGGAASTGSSTGTGVGGTGPSTSGTSTSSTSTTTTTSTSTSTTTTGATTSSSSTGTGGGMPLSPCAPSDAFATLDMGIWKTSGNINPGGGHITATVMGGNAAMSLTAGGTYDECYVSVAIQGTPSDQNGRVILGLNDHVANGLDDALYEQHSPNPQVVATPGGTAAHPPSGATTHLGIAFHASKTYYLWGDATTWHAYTSLPRGAWQDDAADDYFYFGIVAMDGKSAVFDDFDVRPISVGDLP